MKGRKGKSVQCRGNRMCRELAVGERIVYLRNLNVSNSFVKHRDGMKEKYKMRERGWREKPDRIEP